MLDAKTATLEGFQGGMPPLMYAAVGGDDAMIAMLLKRGANVNALDEDGQSALFFACVSASASSAKLLLRHGVRRDVLNHNSLKGGTPLTVASENGRSEIVTLLLAHDADMNARGGAVGFTPLIAAAQHGKIDVVKILVGAGADINAATTAQGVTALMFAALTDNEAVVRFLLTAGANSSIRCNKNMTARDYAEMKDDDNEWSRNALAVIDEFREKVAENNEL
jgi:ankyrin repeat protein